MSSRATGYTDYDIAASTNISGLVSGNKYLVVEQLQSGHIGYLGVSYTGKADTYVNDESNFGYQGIYGLSTWTESSSYYQGSVQPSDAVMKITGAASTPEPASMAVLGLGALALLRRRRR